MLLYLPSLPYILCETLLINLPLLSHHIIFILFQTASTVVSSHQPTSTPVQVCALENSTAMPPDKGASSLVPNSISELKDPTDTQSSPNIHPMVSRSKSGITKKKTFLTTKHVANVPKNTYFHSVEPSNYTDASKSPQWREAMSIEFSALQRHGTWSLVPPQADKNIYGCRWVYRIKHNPDGTVAQYKARLIARGFHRVWS